MVVSSESGGCVGGVLADGGDDSRRLRDGRRLDRMGAVMSGLALYLPRRSRFIPEITDYHTVSGVDGRPVLRARFTLGTRGTIHEYDVPVADLRIVRR
jgi:hypothetical protein